MLFFRSKFVLFAIIFLAVIAILVSSSEAKSRRRKKHSKAMILRQKETNAVDFIRLTVMRLIYGIATRIGFGEQISEALNGVFVPPGAEDYSDYGGVFNQNDDYDY